MTLIRLRLTCTMTVFPWMQNGRVRVEVDFLGAEQDRLRCSERGNRAIPPTDRGIYCVVDLIAFL